MLNGEGHLNTFNLQHVKWAARPGCSSPTRPERLAQRADEVIALQTMGHVRPGVGEHSAQACDRSPRLCWHGDNILTAREVLFCLSRHWRVEITQQGHAMARYETAQDVEIAQAGTLFRRIWKLRRQEKNPGHCS